MRCTIFLLHRAIPLSLFIQRISEGGTAKEVLIRARKKIDYVSEELSLYTFSPYLHQLDNLMGDESTPVFYNKNNKMPKQPECEHYRLGLIL